MNAQQSLRKLKLRSQTLRSAWLRVAHDAILVLDPTAHLLETSEAIVSREVVRQMWDSLPDEHQACHFESIEQQTTDGIRLIERFGPDVPVTLHLGYDVLAFATTLRAAWLSWGNFCETNTEAYNVCLYPDCMSWYVVRAGRWHVYPMDCLSGDEPVIVPGWLAQ